jgi:hypothetical protein
MFNRECPSLLVITSSKLKTLNCPRFLVQRRLELVPTYDCWIIHQLRIDIPCQDSKKKLIIIELRIHLVSISYRWIRHIYFLTFVVLFFICGSRSKQYYLYFKFIGFPSPRIQSWNAFCSGYFIPFPWVMKGLLEKRGSWTSFILVCGRMGFYRPL